MENNLKDGIYILINVNLASFSYFENIIYIKLTDYTPETQSTL